MKKIATVFMFTFLALTGYYVGVAVAQSGADSSSAAEPVGVMVVEEDYSVEAVPTSSSEKNDSQSSATTEEKDSNSNENSDTEILEEDVEEED